MAEGGGRDYFAEKAQAWSHEHGEIIVFDSTGTALQDVAAAAAVYRRALEHGEGTRFSFNA
jgi:ornithine cyclodeaminase/alanine dehydrogenase-like protein (mu-crystallin family)